MANSESRHLAAGQDSSEDDNYSCVYILPAVIDHLGCSSAAERADLQFPKYFADYEREFTDRLEVNKKVAYLIAQVQTEQQYDVPPPHSFLASETASVLGISIRKLKTWVRNGWLHPWQVGQMHYFSRAEIQAIVLAQSVTTKPKRRKTHDIY